MPQPSDIRTPVKVRARSGNNGVMEQTSQILEDNGNKLPEVSLNVDLVALESKDRSALLSHISSLQNELSDYQHQMGLLLVDCKNWGPRYEKLKAVVAETEENWRKEETVHTKALEESKKREEAWKRSLEIEKQCILDLEKALREMQMEVIEGKEAAEKQLSQARLLVNEAEDKSLHAESKLHSAEALRAEASRKLAETERKLQEIKAREDALRREQHKWKAEYEAHKGDLETEEENLRNWEKRLKEGQDRLRQGEKLLNSREEYVHEKEAALKQLEKSVKDERLLLEKEQSRFRQEEADLNAQITAISMREKAAIDREVSLDKKEQELLVLQERLGIRERVIEKCEEEVKDKELSLSEERRSLEIERLTLQQTQDSLNEERKNIISMTKVLNDRSADLSSKEEEQQKTFSDLEKQCQSIFIQQEDLEKAKQMLAARESEITKLHESVNKDKQHCQEDKDKLKERAKDLEGMQKQIVLKEQKLFDEKRQFMIEKEELEQQFSLVQKRGDEVEERKKDLELEREYLQEQKLQLEVIKQEREAMLQVQVQLKEEIDSLRECKHDVQCEAEELKAEKERFEKQWESLDEKKEQLRKDENDQKQERNKFMKWVQDEEARLKEEKRELWQQIHRESETLSSDRRAFVISMEVEKAELFSKIQKEREELTRDMELRSSEFEKCLEKRRAEVERKSEELESKLEETLRKERLELQLMMEDAQKEMQFMLKEKQKLEKEREECLNQKEKLELESADIKADIMELQMQSNKLMEQREALHTEKQELMQEAERLKRLTDEAKKVDDSMTNSVQVSQRYTNVGEVLSPQRDEGDHIFKGNVVKEIDSLPEGTSSKTLFGNVMTPARFSWLQKCASIFYQPSSAVKMKSSFGKAPSGNAWAGNGAELNKQKGDSLDTHDQDKNFAWHQEHNIDDAADELPKSRAKPSSSRGKKGAARKSNLRSKRTHSMKAVIEDAQQFLEPLRQGALEGDAHPERQDANSQLSESQYRSGELVNGGKADVHFYGAGAVSGEKSVELTNSSNREQQEVKSGKKRARSISCPAGDQETEENASVAERVSGKRRRQKEVSLVDSPAVDDITGTKRYNLRNSTIANVMAAQVATKEDKEFGAGKTASKGSEKFHEGQQRGIAETSFVEPNINEPLHNFFELQITETSVEAKGLPLSQGKNDLVNVVSLQVVLDGSTSPGDENLFPADADHAHGHACKKISGEKCQLKERNESLYDDTVYEEEEENEIEHQEHIHNSSSSEDAEEENRVHAGEDGSQEQEEEEIVLANIHSPLQKFWHFLST